MLTQSLSDNRFVTSWNHWVKPRSSDRDEAFRETIIRFTSGLLAIFVAFGLVIQLAAFGISSFVVLIAAILIISLASAVTVNNGNTLAAGWLITLDLYVAALGVTLIGGFGSAVVIPTFMVTVVVTAVVLPRSNIMPVAL